MSKMSLSPNYCSCTVLQARNLPDKGKQGGIDAFCTISMGKEKFATAVVEKTTAPDWREQCDMPIVDDATIKLTVLHQSKNALKGEEFIGRAYVSLRNLQDYDRVHTEWYPLTNKEGKNDKNRGEIQVSLQFYSKNDTTGSVFDLATKKKHSSFKDIKHSLSNKLHKASKHRKDKYAEGNQLAEQRRRLGGDDGSSYLGRDFLEESPSETTSYAGSHLSLNSMSYNNNIDQHKKNDQKFFGGRNRTQTNGLPDIVVDPKLPKSPKVTKKTDSKSLDVLGIKNVKSTPVHPNIRQELEYLDREELLHVIASQMDVIKKRDTRLKDLEQYTDNLLVKIVEQCPTILQVGNPARKR